MIVDEQFMFSPLEAEEFPLFQEQVVVLNGGKPYKNAQVDKKIPIHFQCPELLEEARKPGNLLDILISASTDDKTIVGHVMMQVSCGQLAQPHTFVGTLIKVYFEDVNSFFSYSDSPAFGIQLEQMPSSFGSKYFDINVTFHSSGKIFKGSFLVEEGNNNDLPNDVLIDLFGDTDLFDCEIPLSPPSFFDLSDEHHHQQQSQQEEKQGNETLLHIGECVWECSERRPHFTQIYREFQKTREEYYKEHKKRCLTVSTLEPFQDGRSIYIHFSHRYNEKLGVIDQRRRTKVTIQYQNFIPSVANLDIWNFNIETHVFDVCKRMSVNVDNQTKKAIFTFGGDIPTSFEASAAGIKSLYCAGTIVDGKYCFSCPWIGISKISPTNINPKRTTSQADSLKRSRENQKRKRIQGIKNELHYSESSSYSTEKKMSSENIKKVKKENGAVSDVWRDLKKTFQQNPPNLPTTFNFSGLDLN